MTNNSSDKIDREICPNETIGDKYLSPIFAMTGPCDVYYNGKKIDYYWKKNVLIWY